MTNRELLDEHGFGQQDSHEDEAKWQKHVIVALWIIFAVLGILAVIFVCAEGQGVFQSSTGGGTPAWPMGWP